MVDEKKMQVDEARELDDDALETVAGGGKGGKCGMCPGCGSTAFTDLGGGKIRCNDCGWTGTKADIGL